MGHSRRICSISQLSASCLPQVPPLSVLVNMIGADSLLDSGKYSDLKILCGGESISAHRAILCSVSPVIAAECDLDMRERRTGEIKHEEFNISTVRRLVKFAYTGTYDVSADEAKGNASTALVAMEQIEEMLTAGAPSPDVNGTPVASLDEPSISTSETGQLPIQLLEHVRVYGIAEYYNIPKLKTLAAQRFGDLFEKVWNIRRAGALLDIVRDVVALCPGKEDELRLKLVTTLTKDFLKLGTETQFFAELGRLERADGFAMELLQHGAHFANTTLADSQDLNVELLSQVDALRSSGESLHATLLSRSTAARFEVETAEEKLAHLEGVMNTLISDLRKLPSDCQSARCENAFGYLVFERKGHSKYEGGDWVIRCGQATGYRGRNVCRCKLS